MERKSKTGHGSPVNVLKQPKHRTLPIVLLLRSGKLRVSEHKTAIDNK